MWGRSDCGQSSVPGDLTNLLAVAGSYVHSLVLRSDETAVAWGGNDCGQTNVPPGLSHMMAIAAGCWHNLALQEDGTIVPWGRCGESSAPSGLKGLEIAAGDLHSIALLGTAPPVLQAAISNPKLSDGAFSLSLPTQSRRVYAVEYKPPTCGGNAESRNPESWGAQEAAADRLAISTSCFPNFSF